MSTPPPLLSTRTTSIALSMLDGCFVAPDSLVTVDWFNTTEALRVLHSSEPLGRICAQSTQLTFRTAHLPTSSKPVPALKAWTVAMRELVVGQPAPVGQVLRAVHSAVRTGRFAGVLLHGLPGSGKTHFVNSLSQSLSELDASTSIAVLNASQLFDRFEGQSEAALSSACESNEIVVLENVDLVAGSRSLMQHLCSILDVVQEHDPRKRKRRFALRTLIGTTAQVDHVDDRLRRSGRLDVAVELNAPRGKNRAQLIRHFLSTEAPDTPDLLPLDDLVQRTHGFVASDLKHLVRELVMCTLRHQRLDSATPLRAALLSTVSRIRPALLSSQSSSSSFSLPLDVSWDTSPLAGAEEAWEQLRFAITHRFAGVLICGPSGTGKTVLALAAAAAAQSSAHPLIVRASDLVSKEVGSSERAVRELMWRARQTAPCVLVMDQLEMLAPPRTESNNAGDRLLSLLLTELDGVLAASGSTGITLIGTAVDKRHLDPAILRPGRLDLHIELQLPDAEQRERILRSITAKMPVDEASVDFAELAARTSGQSGAQLCGLCTEAGMRALRSGDDVLTMKHFVP